MMVWHLNSTGKKTIWIIVIKKIPCTNGIAIHHDTQHPWKTTQFKPYTRMIILRWKLNMNWRKQTYNQNNSIAHPKRRPKTTRTIYHSYSTTSLLDYIVYSTPHTTISSLLDSIFTDGTAFSNLNIAKMDCSHQILILSATLNPHLIMRKMQPNHSYKWR